MASIRTTIVLAVLTAALVAACIVAEATRPEFTPEGNISLFSFKTDEAVKVKIEFPEKGAAPIEAVRGPEGWKLAKPLECDADRETLERVVAYMGLLAATAKWSENDSAMSKLAAARIVVTVDLKDGKQCTAWLGALTGSEFRGIARVSSMKGIFEVSRAIFDAADRDFFEFREKRLLMVDYFDVDGMTFERGGVRHVVEKRGEGWRVLEPVHDEADEVRLFDFLSKAVQIKAQGFAAETAGPAELAGFGLAEPEAVIALKGKGRLSTLSLGRRKSQAGGFEWFARRHDRPFVAAVSAEAAAAVEIGDRFEFRGRSLLPDPNAWELLEVEVGGEIGGRRIDFKAEKRQFRWMLTRPTDRDLDPSDDSLWKNFVNKLLGLSIEEFVSESPAPSETGEKYGLDGRAVTIRARLQNSTEQAAPKPHSVELRLGKVLEQQGVCFAKREGRPNVFTVNSSILTDLARGYVRFLNRDLEPIRSELLQWFEFTYQGKKVRFERKGAEETRWVAVLPENAAPAVPSRVEAAFSTAMTKAEAYVEEVADPDKIPAEYKLAEPVAVLRTSQLENSRPGARTVVKEIHFGAFKSNSNLYARYKKGDFSQGDLIFLIGRSSFDVLIELWEDAFKSAGK